MFPYVSSASLMATIEHSMTLLRRCLPGERWGKHALIQTKSCLVSGIWRNCEESHFVELAYIFQVPLAPLGLVGHRTLSFFFVFVLVLMCVTPAGACPQAHQCTMCILGSMFSFQPNKQRQIYVE